MQIKFNRLMPLIVFCALFNTPAQSAIYSATLNFGEPNWSGTVKYDSTTAEPFDPSIPEIDIYELTEMSIANDSIAWSFDEIDGVFPRYGWLIDTAGTAALWVAATDSSSGERLISALGLEVPTPPSTDMLIQWSQLIGGTKDPKGSAYTADDGEPVPEPTSLALLSLGLAGIGAARRRKV